MKIAIESQGRNTISWWIGYFHIAFLGAGLHRRSGLVFHQRKAAHFLSVFSFSKPHNIPQIRQTATLQRDEQKACDCECCDDLFSNEILCLFLSVVWPAIRFRCDGRDDRFPLATAHVHDYIKVTAYMKPSQSQFGFITYPHQVENALRSGPKRVCGGGFLRENTLTDHAQGSSVGSRPQHKQQPPPSSRVVLLCSAARLATGPVRLVSSSPSSPFFRSVFSLMTCSHNLSVQLLVRC